jgi:predicted MFS family arabinose efflux permease
VLTAESSVPSFGRTALTILGLAMAPAIGLGIGRFAYALVLPDMRAALHWSYAEAGFMNTVNAAGYLIGALMAAPLAARLGLMRTLLLGSFAVLASLLASAVWETFFLLCVARLLAGAGAALAFVAGGSLAAGLSLHHGGRGSFLLSLFYVGPGIGIASSGAMTPLLIERLGPGSWQMAWGALTLLGLVLASGLILGRQAAGGAPPSQPKTGDRIALGPPGFILASYFLFGIGYIAYMTFMIAWLQERGGGPGVQATFWVLIGAGGVISPFAWSWVYNRFTGGRPVMVLLLITMAGSVLPLFSAHSLVLAISALLFGSSFFAVVAGTTAFVRKNYPQRLWPRGIGVMTITFSVGQTFGPVLVGVITDVFGGLSLGLGLSAGCLALAAILAALQQDLKIVE